MLSGMTDDVSAERSIDPLRKRIGDNVRAELARQGRSQDFLQPVLGLVQSQISKRINGRIGFEGRELVLIAQALDVPVARLVEVEADLIAGAA